MSKVLVLNSDYSPLNVTTLSRGFTLVNQGKAEIIRRGDIDIITTIGSFVRPIIIRLLNYIRFRPKVIRVTRKRLLKRDNNSCQYCGTTKHLTIDHIIPKSRGGKNTWSNLVTCCLRCNSNKGDRTPDEANMKLRNKPYEPSIFSSVIHDDVGLVWEDFKQNFR
jgi:hypothetical protein